MAEEFEDGGGSVLLQHDLGGRLEVMTPEALGLLTIPLLDVREEFFVLADRVTMQAVMVEFGRTIGRDLGGVESEDRIEERGKKTEGRIAGQGEYQVVEVGCGEGKGLGVGQVLAVLFERLMQLGQIRSCAGLGQPPGQWWFKYESGVPDVREGCPPELGAGSPPHGWPLLRSAPGLVLLANPGAVRLGLRIREFRKASRMVGRET